MQHLNQNTRNTKGQLQIPFQGKKAKRAQQKTDFLIFSFP
jgi:hypothetical protein